MAEIKVSALPAATAPDGTEVVPVVQGGVTKRLPVGAAGGLATLLANGKHDPAQSATLVLPPPPVGLYLGEGGVGQASTQYVNAAVYLTPLRMAPGTVDRIVIMVNTVGSAGSVHRLGIYKQRVGERFGTCDLLVDGGTVDTATTTGLKELVVAATIPFDGLYFLAVVQQGAPATTAAIDSYNILTMTDLGGIPLVTGGFNNGFLGFKATASQAGALAPTTTGQAEFTNQPRVYVRYA